MGVKLSTLVLAHTGSRGTGNLCHSERFARRPARPVSVVEGSCESHRACYPCFARCTFLEMCMPPRLS